ncbi:MAG: serine/threonine-protein kinase [Isosphaeraceae bacterium]|nr:serine/threonine-protein kinase [Isosphaeraceae bacterium]
MSATARDLTAEDMRETVAYEPNTESGLDRPTGSSDMPTKSPQGPHRYTFGSGARPLDGYTIKRAIGRGGFGEVYYATSDSGKEVALKLILHNLEVERRGVVQCMNLKCPNLLTVYDLKSNDAGESFVVMEYVAGPSLAHVLSQYPNGMPLNEIRVWLKGLVEGVAYLHDHGVVHRDLKPANIFMEEGIVKIGDYGLAKLITPGQATGHSESIGTCHYMAPEIASGKYNKPIDVYAIGVILYEMLMGRVPFEGESVGEILMKHLTARPDLSRLAEPYKSIVARALAKDPNHRPTRVHDLLPPEDAPRKLDVRFIGDGKKGQAPAVEKEDILRIGAEEPVFYIGPDTRPPQPPRPTVAQRLRANWVEMRRQQEQNRVRPAAAPRPAPVRRPAVRPVVLRPVAPSPPPPPPEPPVLPGARIRVAELATSMLWAAPFVALLAVPVGALLGIDLTAQPQQLAYLAGMALLGVWGVLIPAKAMEGRKIDSTTRRLVFLGVGVALGAIGLGLTEWVRVGLTPGSALRDLHLDSRAVDQIADWFERGNLPLRHLSYFGILYAVNGWWKLAARDRKARFRVWPTLVATGIGAILLPFWPYAQPEGVAVTALIAVVTQLVSPWSENAAAYARWSLKQRIV